MNRRNLVHYAAANENPDILEFLIKSGADPNEFDSRKTTPLMIAAELGKLHNIKVIIEANERKKKVM